jgi:hypothetical protein
VRLSQLKFWGSHNPKKTRAAEVPKRTRNLPC